MSITIVLHVKRKESHIQDEAWVEFCKRVNRHKAGVFEVIKINENRYEMVDQPSVNGPWQFDSINFVECHKNGEIKVNNTAFRPKHYEILDEPTIELLASSSTEAEWRGFCRNSILKYRLRAGKKDKLEQDIGKADEYEVIFKQYKHLCRKE